jgi:hypothetical protein
VKIKCPEKCLYTMANTAHHHAGREILLVFMILWCQICSPHIYSLIQQKGSGTSIGGRHKANMALSSTLLVHCSTQDAILQQRGTLKGPLGGGSKIDSLMRLRGGSQMPASGNQQSAGGGGVGSSSVGEEAALLHGSWYRYTDKSTGRPYVRAPVFFFLILYHHLFLLKNNMPSFSSEVFAAFPGKYYTYSSASHIFQFIPFTFSQRIRMAHNDACACVCACRPV